MHRTALRLTLVAILATSVTPLAHASAVTAVSAGGRTLHPGSVVATGRLVGDNCVFGSATAVTVRTRVAAGLGLRTDGACRLVVSRLDATARSSAGASYYSAAPKVDSDTPAVGPEPSSVGGGIGAVDGAVADATSAVDTVDLASTNTSVRVTLSQSIYDAVGSLQYEDEMEVVYLKSNRNGSVHHMEATDGYCRGAGLADNPVNNYTDVATTEIRDCYYKQSANGPAKVAFATGGYYRQLVLGYERDARQLTESYSERSDGTVSHTCSPGGTLPRYWSTYCFLNRVA